MKNISTSIVTAGLIGGGFLNIGWAESTIHDTYTGFELSEQVVLPEAEIHPSLWFRTSEVSSLIEKRTADTYIRSVWEKVASSPFLLATLPEVPDLEDDKTTIHRYYGDLTQIAFFNAFLYQVGEVDQKPAYLATAKEALLRGYEGPMYEMDPVIKGTAVDEIYQAVWSQSFAAAYDMTQPGLTESEDRQIREILARHAQYIYDNLYSWIGKGKHGPHNHLSKPAWGLGTLALCLSDHEDARSWLRRAVEATNHNTRNFFGEDGIYREGSHYYIFSLINFLPFLYHYEHISGVEAFAAFQPAFEWPILIRNGKGWIPNQEDSYIRPFPSQLIAGAYRDAPTRLHTSAPLSSILQWNFENTDYGPFDSAEASTGFNYTGASWDYPKPLIEFLCYEAGIEAVAPDLEPTVFLPSGQTLFRNDWSFASPDHRYLLFQGVAEAKNHEHYEHLSFILQAENQMMSSDSGYSRKSYGEAIRTEWYRTPEAHNVVMVNGQAPMDRGNDVTPESRYRLVSPFFACEMKTAPYAAGGTHRRLVAFLDKRWFGIVDQVELPEVGEISVVMHGGRAQLEQVGNRALWSYEQDVYGPAATLGQWFFGQGFQFEQKMGELTYIKGDYAAFPYSVNTNQGTSAFALSILDPASNRETLSEFSVDAMEGDRIAVRGPTTRIMANGSGDQWVEGDLDSDGLLAVVWTDGSASSRVAMAGGRRLRLGDRLSIELSSSAAIATELGSEADSITVYLSDDLEIDAKITASGLSWKGLLKPGRQEIQLVRR